MFNDIQGGRPSLGNDYWQNQRKSDDVESDTAEILTDFSLKKQLNEISLFFKDKE